MNRFVIEHPVRGVFTEGDWDAGTPLAYKPRFSWSRPSTSGYVFYSIEAARREMRKWSVDIAGKCTIKKLVNRR